MRLLKRPTDCAGRLLKQFSRAASTRTTGVPSTQATNRLARLPVKVRQFVEKQARICQPAKIYVCDGSPAENERLLQQMEKDGQIISVGGQYKNCYLARTDPADVARVESRTVISTEKKSDTIPTPREGVKGTLGNWISREDMAAAAADRFPGCMKGRTMYVIPFSMGPLGSPLSKIGIEVTDSPYVVASMRIMTRMGSHVLDVLGEDDFVKCVHSVGQPLPMKALPKNNWPCNPEKTIIAHIPDDNEILSYGSGYGGNSLLGKKCLALRLGSKIAQREGWLAEHMLILGITNPAGQKKYVAAAFPSACGKTNLAMMTPTLPGFKVECVGDDIAWMKFDQNGQLKAINPEYGFFGVAPGTSDKTNPIAMKTIKENTIFTNVALTSEGNVYWEGLESEIKGKKDLKITSWKGQDWTLDSKEPSSHPNSRFCAPASQCPILDPNWESQDGVPISAIIFGGRRPQGVPLVYEAFDWNHGVFVGAALRSEATAAAEHKGKVVMHDPFAMRPFFGYNFGHYLDHWLSFGTKPGLKLPKIFHVNWFRRGEDGSFLWPGFGENSRVLDWICRRVDGEDSAAATAIGYIPKEGALNLEGLDKPIDLHELFHLPTDFWLHECEEIAKYFDGQVGDDLPEEVAKQLLDLKARFEAEQRVKRTAF